MGLLQDLQTAIATEIKAQRRARHSFWITIDRIDLLRERAGRFIYRLELGQDLRVVSDTELTIKVPGQKDTFRVQVLISDGRTLVITSDTPLAQQLSLVRVQFDPTFILEHLAADLALVLHPPTPIVRAVLRNMLPAPHTADDIKEQHRLQQQYPMLNHLQRSAIARMQADTVHVLWGPPGTGKTKTLGAAITAHIRAGKSCLLLSTSNAAVDELVKATAPLLGAAAVRTIFRTGVSADPQVDHLTAVGYFRRQNHVFAVNADAAQTRLTALTSGLRATVREANGDATLREVQACKVTIASFMEAAKLHGEEVLRESTCVAATLASLVINPVLAQRRFDVVYIDEASMVALPFAIAGAARATQQLIVAGDFQQLPPVCHATDADTSDWFARNIFDHLDIPRAARTGIVPPQVSMLREQYRMTTTIADLVSRLSYGGRLVSNAGIQPGVRPLMIDVGRTCGTSPYSVELKSYYQPYSALLLHTLARKFHDWLGPQTLLLSPFRAQQALLTAVATDISTADIRFESRTIHKAQGMQEDTVIVDLTAHDPSHPQKFFTGEETEKLINVALSRAQQRLIIIGNLELIRDLARKGGYWARFWTLVEEGCTYIDARNILASATHGGDVAHALQTLGTDGNTPHMPSVYVESAEFPCPARIEQLFRTNQATTKLLVRRSRGGHALAGITLRHDLHGTVPPLAVAQGVVALPVQWGMHRGRWFVATLPETTKQIMFLACGHLLDDRFTVEDTLRLQCSRCTHGLLLKHQFGDYYLVCSQSMVCGYTRPITITDARVLIETYNIRCPTCRAKAQPRVRRAGRSVFLGCSNYPGCDGTIDMTVYLDHG